jgi:predicted CXXCH cytochrome family protein
MASYVPGKDRIPIGKIALLALLLTAILLSTNRSSICQLSEANSPIRTASYVGAEACSSCHAKEATAWKGTHHNLAMRPANSTTVLGDFNDTTFKSFGHETRFFRKGDDYFVETEARSGRIQTFPVKYTFGVFPLQQYLIDFPDGRKQALTIAWDSRPRENGGQRWFHLYPDEDVAPTDSLHWTGLQQNWNFMCADCHSTNLRKNFDERADTFATAWTDINVGCEACHGPGSAHLDWAAHQKASGAADSRKGFLTSLSREERAAWIIDNATGNAAPHKEPHESVEVEVCGRCHARRGSLGDNWPPASSLSDTHDVALLQQYLFEANGQMKEEVFNYQSFKQSKMYSSGVICSDCHDPHSQKLKASASDICAQCHDFSKYKTAKHQLREHQDSKVDCISCHMPQRTYMVVDVRHDHSFRIPRPDLSETIGTSNTCNDCHRDKPFGWASEQIRAHYGGIKQGFQNFAEALHAARSGKANAAQLLAKVVQDKNEPAIARATAYAEFASIPAVNADLLTAGLSDRDPLVRIGALRGLSAVPVDRRWTIAGALINDPVRSVRIAAAQALAQSTTGLSGSVLNEYEKAANEFVSAQHFNDDRPEARSNLGNFFALRGRPNDAEIQYKAALRLDHGFSTAAVSLADLYRRTGRSQLEETTLRRAISFAPKDAAVNHALGLFTVRRGDLRGALSYLQSATEADRDNVQYSYVYAIALNSSGDPRGAIGVLRANQSRHPTHIATLTALITINRDTGDSAEAIKYAKLLFAAYPSAPGISTLLESLEKARKN